jgi:hypothetical protein
MAQERRLARAGFSRKEERAAGVLYYLQGLLQLSVVGVEHRD